MHSCPCSLSECCVELQPLPLVRSQVWWVTLCNCRLKTCKFGSTQGTNNEVNGRCDYDEAWRELLLLREELQLLGANHAVATGTLLGLLKFGRLCPWDYDVDVNVWLSSWEEVCAG